MKKAMILLLAMLLTVTWWGGSTLEWKQTEFQSGDYSYVLLEDGTAEITRYKGGVSGLSVPGNLDGYIVTSIGGGSFSGCMSLGSIVLPEGLKSVGDFAFGCCFELASVTLPDSLISMGANPFVDFSDLESIHLSPGHPVFAVTDGVLFNTKEGILVAYPTRAKPGAYQVPLGTRTIGANAFWYRMNLTSVVLPEGLESIAECAFFSCSELESMELPKSLKSVGEFAFGECPRLVLLVPQDSFAQQYAQDNRIPFEVISK